MSDAAKLATKTGIALLLTAFGAAGGTKAEKVRLDARSLELPGAPAAVVATDLDGDGREDLAVAVVYTVWEELGIAETVEMDEVEGLVEVLTIVPALMDHRELHLYRGTAEGGYEPWGEPLPLDPSVLSMEAGPEGFPLLALTDDGISVLRVGENGASRLEPWIDERPALAGTVTFLKDLGLLQSLGGAATPDLLIHTLQGYALYLDPWSEDSPERSGLVPLPELDLSPQPRTLHVPLPEVRDVDGDGLADLLVPHPERLWADFRLFLNRGGGAFQGPLDPLEPLRLAREKEEKGREEEDEKEEDEDAEPTYAEEVEYFGDLDGDGRAEYVTVQEVDKGGGDGMRAEMDEAKRPLLRYRLYRQVPGLGPAAEAFATFEAEGYAFGGSDTMPLPGGFRDLDGDGRLDLVTINLEFSLMQVVRVMAVKSFSMGLDFNVLCQGASGPPAYRLIEGLDLSGRFNLNLNNLKVSQLSQFAGDFDGDGRADFLQMGRGKKVTLHLGREGCRYPTDPDLTLVLDEEPKDLSLVQVKDFDGDGLADLLVMQPRPAPEPGVSPPVRLDFYLSGGRS